MPTREELAKRGGAGTAQLGQKPRQVTAELHAGKRVEHGIEAAVGQAQELTHGDGHGEIAIELTATAQGLQPRQGVQEDNNVVG